MEKQVKRINVSEVRGKLTKLEKLIKPGEVLEITRRGKAFARVELLSKIDPYEKVLRSIDLLPEPEEALQAVAENYKSLLYGIDDHESSNHLIGISGQWG